MKKELFAALSILALIIGAVVNILYLMDLANGISYHVEASQQYCRDDDFDQAEAELRIALEIWLKADGYTHIFIRHVEIDGTELWLTTYILNDKTGEINKVDEVNFNKKAGENKVTFEGDNTTSEMDYNLGIVPSFFNLAKYAITKWLPEFFKMLPALLESVIVEDTF